MLHFQHGSSKRPAPLHEGIDIATIVPLADAAPDAVERLLDTAFGADRRTRTAYRIRAGAQAIASLSFAAMEGGTLVGSLQSWPVALDGQTPLILVGPVAVLPTMQRQGIGRRMMERLIGEVDGAACPPLVLIGDPEYYGRLFGFTAAATRLWQVPGPVEQRRLLVRAADGVALPEAGMLGPRRA